MENSNTEQPTSKDLVIYWNSVENNEPINALLDTIKEIRVYFDCVTHLTDFEQFRRFIEENPTRNLLIVTGNLSNENETILTQLIEKTENIESFFVLLPQSVKNRSQKLLKLRKCQACVNSRENLQKSIERYFFLERHPSSSPKNLKRKIHEQSWENSSFIYSKTLKELLIEATFKEAQRKELLDFIRCFCSDNNTKLKQIDEFENEYRSNSPIWWFTKESCIYTFLDDALNGNDYETMIKVGFFLKDLCSEVKKIHQTYPRNRQFIVYRGHGMSCESFEKMKKNQGQPWAFHKFLSTSFNRIVALQFVDYNRENTDTVGVLFEIEIDSDVRCNSYAFLGDKSYYSEAESELLFAPHAVFMIGDIKQLKDKLWEVKLTTVDEKYLNKTDTLNFIKNTLDGKHSWCCIAKFLTYLGSYEAAIEIFERTLSEADTKCKSYFNQLITMLYNNFGMIDILMENYDRPKKWLCSALKSHTENISANFLSLSKILNNLSVVFHYLGDYLQAYYHAQNALSRVTSMPKSEILLATVATNLGRILITTGEFDEASTYFELAKTAIPPIENNYYPLMAMIENNTAALHITKGEYEDALKCYENVLNIYETYLPPHDPSWIRSLNNIAYTYQMMARSREALCYYEYALQVQSNIPYSNSLLFSIYNNMGTLYRLCGDYTKAKQFYEQCLKVQEHCELPETTASIYIHNNIAVVLAMTGNHSRSVSHYERAIQLIKEFYSKSHPQLGMIYNNLGSVYASMRQWKDAVQKYRDAILIMEKETWLDRLALADVYNNLGEFYRENNEYKSAITYFEKAIDIETNSSIKNHPSFAKTYINQAVAKDALGLFDEAIKSLETASQILSKVYGPEHSQMTRIQQFQLKIKEKISKS